MRKTWISMHPVIHHWSHTIYQMMTQICKRNSAT
uniref:Uncharacterized protein n=1 Tax=Arundo donax TaxID=35708 RepID=A0A0A9NGJ2_ARUDO